MATVQCGIGLIGLFVMMDVESRPDVIAWFVFLPWIVALQMFHSSPFGQRLGFRRAIWTIGLQEALIYVPPLFFSVQWPGMPGFAAACALVVLRGWVGDVLFVANVAGAWALGWHSGLSYSETACVTAVTVVIGLGDAALIGLSWRLGRISRLESGIVRGAAQDERVRIARDLHDLLASRLTTVTLRGEMVDRYVGVQNDRARSELRYMMGLTREVLRDVRSLAHDCWDLSLVEELDNARLVLSGIGIEVSVVGDADVVEGEAGILFAVTMREAVANLLRHSKATCCHITLRCVGDRAELLVRNDGARKPTRRIGSASGLGLGNLAARAAATGGSCTASISRDGWYTLTVSCPRGATPECGSPAATPLREQSGPHPADFVRRVS
ncbi:histidine kinase [Streptomyces sp. NBC_00285]|uniref:sensor histidine kinase n=1 Tax=Streptomyces sp. NBC_00285 TaxID=2975700 RepID=UPI002E2A02D9|nr:histidine kinase [Streptomyces sp. NBC_00285]